jgi:hypothetical protein
LYFILKMLRKKSAKPLKNSTDKLTRTARSRYDPGN